MARPKSDAADFVAFPVRFPRELLARIKARASQERRPINTQIIMCLEEGEAVVAHERTLLAGTDTPKPSLPPA